jgi:hypothetical protein
LDRPYNKCHGFRIGKQSIDFEIIYNSDNPIMKQILHGSVNNYKLNPVFIRKNLDCKVDKLIFNGFIVDKDPEVYYIDEFYYSDNFLIKIFKKIKKCLKPS